MISSYLLLATVSIILGTMLLVSAIIHDYQKIKREMLNKQIESNIEVLKMRIDYTNKKLIIENKSSLPSKIIRFYVVNSGLRNIYTTNITVENTLPTKVDITMQFPDTQSCILDTNNPCTVIALTDKGNTFTT